MHTSTVERLERLIQSTVDQRSVFGAVLQVESRDKLFQWAGSAGNVTPNSSFFIASTTKLYVTAVILKLRAQHQLQLTDRIDRYIDKEMLSGIHIYQGTAYSEEITIEQLLAHTSGLPDYFQQTEKGSPSLMKQLFAGQDQAWSFETVMEKVKHMKPLFPPGTRGKAHYADTNYQLLGKIVETVTNLTLSEAFDQYIFRPLSLVHTYLYIDAGDHTPVPLYYKNKPLPIPRAMSSFGPDGGMVSTAQELMRFLRAFMEGELFPASYLEELYRWNRIFFPLQYGVGIAKFQLPRIFSPFQSLPALIGHSGLSGAFAYYCPAKKLYLSGTVNQITPPSLAYKMMIKAMHAVT